jgi:hypothetical protein
LSHHATDFEGRPCWQLPKSFPCQSSYAATTIAPEAEAAASAAQASVDGSLHTDLLGLS